MTISLKQPTTSATSVLATACSASLAAGIVDVSVALLSKPQDFAGFAALAMPILAVATAFLTCFLVLWLLVKPVVARTAVQINSAAAALAACLLTFFALAVLLDLFAASPSPHSVFRAGLIGVISIAMGLGVLSMHEATSPSGKGYRYTVLTLGAPIVMFEVLVYEWLQVYPITSVASFASALASVLLLAIGAATIAVFARISTTAAARVLAVFVLSLALTPALVAYVPLRAGGVRADVNRQPGAPRLIIFVTIDTLRRDAVSVYGRGNPTPAIDGLAADSVVFENAWSTAPWTLPSLASIQSGLSPSVHGVTGLTSRLSDHVTTVAETLARHGYRTAAIVHNPLLEPARNFAQGIDDYVDVHEPSYGDSVGAWLLQKLAVGIVPPPTWPSTADQTAIAIDWLKANRSESFFLWLHYFDPHAPYAPPRNDLPQQLPAGMDVRFDQQTTLAKGTLVPPLAARQWIRELYNAEVRDVDTNVGRLIETLKELHLYDEALIVLSSDHGEEFWEHGRQGHGQSLYPELLQVPLIVKLPRSEAREHVPALVSTMSITPTLLDLCRIPFGPEDFSAPSLGPLLKPGSPVSAPLVVSSVVWTAGSLVDEQQAVSFDNFHYISAQIAGKEELFDQRADAGDQHSVADSALDQVATAKRLLSEQAQRARALRARLQIETTELGLDDETSRRLRTLGYVH